MLGFIATLLLFFLGRRVCCSFEDSTQIHKCLHKKVITLGGGKGGEAEQNFLIENNSKKTMYEL